MEEFRNKILYQHKVLNVKLFDGSFLTLFNAKDASSHHNI